MYDLRYCVSEMSVSTSIRPLTYSRCSLISEWYVVIVWFTYTPREAEYIVIKSMDFRVRLKGFECLHHSRLPK